MRIEYSDHLPDKFRASAARLYFDALHEKLEPVLGTGDRAQTILEESLSRENCLAAFAGETLAGIMGVQTARGGFMNPDIRTMTSSYGTFGGLIRIAGLAMLHHPTQPDELHVDGVAVAPAARGRGIGTCLFDRLEKKAAQKGIRTLSLEVIDTNPKAKALYLRLGYKTAKTRKLGLINRIVRFPFESACLMTKEIA